MNDKSGYAPNFPADSQETGEGLNVEISEGGEQATLTPEQQKQLASSVRGIINDLEKEAFDRVTRRTTVENRWVDDLSQYHGIYSESIKKDLQDNERSVVFLNQTRPKTNAMEARLSDMLFPTDDRNWGISPTPVPELTVQAEELAKAAAAAKSQAVANPDDPQAQDASTAADAELALMQAEVDEARKRARLMEEEIDDALRECNYPAQAREVIRDACRIGTGIVKGPVTDGSSRRSWQKGADNVYQIVYAAEKKVSLWRVDPWNFFPDPDATKQEESESDFERHLLNSKQLRKLARQPGFNTDAIRELLRQKPTQALPTYLPRLRSLTGTADMLTGRYHVWEYHGSIEAKDLEKLAMAIDPGMLDELPQEADPLDELKVVLWFCQGECLKIGIYPLDSGDSIYDVFNLERDETSVFGFGIPYLMRDSQSSIAGAWRMVMDNMGLAAGPQIVINREVIEPADGKWVLKPRKLWLRKAGTTPDQKPFEVIEIQSALADLMTVVEASKRNIDEETALPLLAQGEQGAQVTKTAGGMSMLMNSVNVVFRRIVKNWDDLVTTPLIRRLYDWQMQFNKKDYIKGDFNVDARGTSVLLVREMQTANLLAFLVHFANHPTLGKFLKSDGLPALRRYAQVLMVPPDEVIKSDQEVAKDERDQAAQPPPPDPEMEKIAAMLNLEEVRGKNALDLEGARRESGLILLAGKNNMDLEKLKAMLFEGQQDRDHKERAMAVEAAITKQEIAADAPTGGGSF